MSKSFKNFLQVFIILLFELSSIISISTLEKCSAGMRTTFIDNRNAVVKGTARKIPLSISFYEDLGGAVWLNRQVRIEPRFEVHLKVMVNDLTKDQLAEYQKLHGFTIILSKTKDYLSGHAANNGYEGLTNSYLAEIDGDEIDSTFTLHQCFGSTKCSSSQTGTPSKSFTPKYKHNENFQFDIRFTYDHSKQEAKICFGETPCLTENINLITKFGTPKVYLGFTGFNKGNRRELNMLGTFVCEDRFDFPKTETYFSFNGKQLEGNKITVGDTIRFVYSPNDIYSYQVPFYDDLQKMNTKINANSCKVIQAGELNFYQRWIDFKCDDVGDGEICLYEKDANVCEHSTKFKVVSSNPEVCIAIGHDGKDFKAGETIWNAKDNMYELRYDGKYFFLSDYATKNITFDVKFKDSFGNDVDLGTTEHSELVQLTSATVKGSGCNFVMSSVADYYRLTISKETTGRCTISIPTMEKQYYFDMLAGAPSPEKSSCTINGQSSTPVLQEEEPFTITCTLNDIYGNPVDTGKLKEYYDVDYHVTFTKKVPEGDLGFGFCTDAEFKGSSFDLECAATDMGTYLITIDLDGAPINSMVNTINVQGMPEHFNEYTRYAFMPDKRWTTSTTTNYYANNEGIVAFIDFTDKETEYLISTYQYSKDFNPATDVKCTLSYPHDPSIKLTSPSAEFYQSNGKTYVAVKYPDSTDNYIKKTSFPYELTCQLKGKDTVKFTINYPLDIGNYITCLHPLDVSKTDIDFNFRIPLTAGDNGITGTVISRTDDKNLYNYIKNFEVIISPSYPVNTIKLSNGTYQGIYNYDLKFKKADNYTLTFKLDGQVFAEKQIQVIPSVGAEIRLPEGSPYRQEDGVYKRDPVTTDSNVRTEFEVYDEYGNQIDFGKDVGITATVTVDGKIIAQDVPIKGNNFADGKYFYEDSSTETGDYKIIFKVGGNGETYEFDYKKTSGDVVKDKIQVINKITYVLYGETHNFEIYFYDKLGKNIADDESLYQQAISKVTIEATTASGKTVTYNAPSLTPDKSARYFSQKLEFSENVNVKVKYDGTQISTFTYQVGYETIDTKKSSMVAKLTTEKAMSPDSTLQLNIATDNPIYKFTFKNSKGEIIKNLDPATTFEAIMELSNRNVTLRGKRSQAYMEWDYPEDWSQMVSGNYKIHVLINGQGSPDLIFPIQIIAAGTEDAEQAPYVVKNTYFFSTIIEGIAGETKTFVMQLRTANDKRCYYDFNMSDIFAATDDNGYLNNGSMKVTFEQGSKKGECICYVTQYKTTQNTLHIKLKKYGEQVFEETASTVTVIMHCAKFNKLVIDPSCIKKGNELQEGTVITIPTVTFTPYDIYDNIYTDLFDSTITTKEFLNSLVSGKHSNAQANLESSAGVDATKQKFTLNLSTQKIGTITLTSKYFEGSYLINVHSGPIDYSKTEVTLTSQSEIVAGTEEVTYKITPRDTYGNIIDYLNETYKDEFEMVAKNEITGNTFTPTEITFTEPYFEFKFNITEKGTIYFDPEYKSDEIDCTTCTIKVDPGEIFLENTKVFYGDIQMDPKQKVTVYNYEYPQFMVKFYDRFNNLVDNLEGVTLTGKIEGEGKSFELYLRTAKDFYTLYVNSTAVKGQWEYLVTSDEYLLKIVAKGQNLDNYPLYIINKESGDASNKDLNPDATIFTPESINIYAGDHIQINMEQKAIDGLRWNNWYEDPEKNISLTFNEGYDGCTYKIDYGDKPGKYVIDLQCEKSTDPNTAIQVNIDGQPIKHTIPLIVNPGKIYYTIAKNKGKEEREKLDDANADRSYSFIIVAYDQYGNIANNNTKDISYSIAPPQTHSGAKIESTIKKNENDFSFTVTLDPIYAGEYTISSTQFQNSKVYKFDSYAGEISPRNSILVTPTSATAGDEVSVCIFAFDKNNNFVEPDPKNNPFELSFLQPSETTETPVTNWKVSTCEYDGEQRPAYVYDQQLRKADDNTFKGTIGDEQINCVSCIVNVVPGEMYFPNSVIERFDPELNQYVELKNGTVEDNKNTEPLYKLIPKDFYGNPIDEITSKTGYNVTLYKEDNPSINYPFKLKDDKVPSQYIEFIKDDEHRTGDKYENLVNSSYIISFKKGDEEINYQIQLKGDVSDDDASNEPADLNKTRITEEKLDFTAGDEGEFYIQITTENGYRKNSHDGYDFKVESCNTSDTSFNYTVEKSGTLGVYIIKVTTTQSNTLPVLKECPLTIYVKNETTDFAPVKDLHPTMVVTPKGIDHAIILDEYIESAGKLKDGNVDRPYTFIVHTFDEYGNRNKGLQSTIRITTSPRIDQSNFVYNENQDGSITYTLTITKAGTYTISSDINPSTQKSYLPTSYTLTMLHGEIDLSRSAVEIEKTKIEAGRTASILISCKDKYDNEIKPNEVGDVYKVVIYDPTNQAISATKEVLENQIKYSVYLSKKGICSWNVKNQNDEDILKKALQVEVTPADADTIKTVYKTGDDHKYDSTTPYSISNTQEKVSFKAEDYDFYGNRIIDDGKMTIFNPVLTGNAMEDITLIPTENKAVFTVAMPSTDVNATAYYTLTHLVSGSGYFFKFDNEKTEKDYTSTISNINNVNEFKNALVKDGKYKLTSNIVISSSEFIVDKKYSVQIDLNKFTITVNAADNSGAKVKGELILKNGNLALSGTGKAIIQLYDGSKYFAYNVVHTGGTSSVAIEANSHAFIEIVGGSFNSSNLFSAEGYPENIILMRGEVNCANCKNAFISTDKSKAELRIYGGQYGFNTDKYKKSTEVMLPVIITSTKDYTGYGNGPFVAEKTLFSTNQVVIRAGDSYDVKLTFRTAEEKLFNDEVSPNYVTFTVEDSSLSYSYQKGNVYGESYVTLTSTKALDSNNLTVKITDKKGNSANFVINVKVLPALIPFAELTRITLQPDKELTPPLNTIHFSLVLSDKYGNEFKNMCDELREVRYAIEEKDQVSSKIAPDNCMDVGDISFSYVVPYPPNSHTINLIYYVEDEGTKVLTEEKAFKVNIMNKVDFTKSDVKCPKCEKITAGEKLDLEVSLYDTNKICYNEEYSSSNIPLGVKITYTGSGQAPVTYNFENAFDSLDSCQNTYKMIDDNPLTKAGEYILEIYGLEGSKQIPIKEYTHIVVAGDPHGDHLYVTRELKEITNPIEILAGEEYRFTVQARDEYDNVVEKQFSDKFGILLINSDGQIYDPADMIKNSFDPKNDGLYYQLSFRKTGNVKLYYTFEEKNVTYIRVDGAVKQNSTGVFESLLIKPGECSKEHENVDYTEVLELTDIQMPVDFKITCFDEFNNRLTEGGTEFSVEMTVTKLDSETSTDVKTKLNDNGDGTYNVTFTPPIEGTYTIVIKIGDTIYSNQRITIKVTPNCPPHGDQEGRNFECPGRGKGEVLCVKDENVIDCLSPDEKCENNPAKPFKCKVNGVDTCVESFTDCDCPSGYTHCEDWYQNQCYPENSIWECPFSLQESCRGKTGYTKLCDDGVCRARLDLVPNKYVCPYGYYQCSDLTCVKSVEECQVYDEFQCTFDEIVCDDQTCASTNADCPTRITCNDPNYYVCPDGTCVANEMQCKPIKCFDPTPILCPSGVCASRRNLCPKGISCGHTYSLCEDNICKHDCRA